MYEKKSRKKKEKKADIVICTDFGKLSEGIWPAYLSMIVNMGKEILNLMMMNMLMLIYCVQLWECELCESKVVVLMFGL